MYRGLYLNLKQSTTRNKLINLELQKLNLSHLYDRFDALNFDGYMQSPLMNTEIGCFKSHIEALKLSLEHEKYYNKHIHIIEDDIVLSNAFPSALDYFFNKLKDNTWDIFFTSFTVPIYKPYYDYFLQYVKNDESDKNTINFFDMNNILLTGAHSYIVNKNSKKKILDNLEKNNFQLPIDLAIRKLITENRIRAYCLYPFISTHQYLESTMNRAKVELPMEFEALSQRAFYKGYNLMDTKALLIKYAKKEGYDIKPMTSLATVLYQILNMRNFINAKYKYKNTLY